MKFQLFIAFVVLAIALAQAGDIGSIKGSLGNKPLRTIKGGSVLHGNVRHARPLPVIKVARLPSAAAACIQDCRNNGTSTNSSCELTCNIKYGVNAPLRGGWKA